MSKPKDLNSSLSVHQLYYSHLDQMAMDDLDSDLVSQMGDLAKGEDHTKRLAHYRKARGRLQMKLASEHLTEDQYESIRSLSVHLKDKSADQNDQEEEDLLMHEIQGVRQRRFRQALIYGSFFTIVLLIARSLFPTPEAEFYPLEALVYETRALENNFSPRVDLESSVLDDVKEYFLNYPKLIWQDELIKVPPGWKLSGASVLDYEIVKISLMAFTKRLSGSDLLEVKREVVSADGTETSIEVVQTPVPRRDMLVHYSFDSHGKSYLPDTKPSVQNGLEYYAYATDEYNIIMWLARGRHHLIVGRLTPIEMADLIP